MGKIRKPPPVKLFLAVTTADQKIWDEIAGRLTKKFSELESTSGWFDFNFTDYYQAEMGTSLKKSLFAFKELVAPDTLPDVKNFTNSLEEEAAIAGRRVINLDPGYLDAAKVVLATTKDYSHRLYLGKGIFGDVHLTFREHHFQNNPWTYPDYQQENIHNFFEEVRQHYFKQLKTAR